MLSRVAQNLYWIGRYVERAENVARLLDVAFHFELDASTVAADAPDLPSPTESVLVILGSLAEYRKVHPTGPLDRDQVLELLSFDRRCASSIVVMLEHARENARASREVLSADAWNQLNGLYLYLRARKARARFAESPLRFFDSVKRGCTLFAGMVNSTLPRDEAYHFLQLGRYLERINQIGRTLQIKLSVPGTETIGSEASWRLVHWSSLLRCCSANEAYLREHHDRLDPYGIVRFLVLNPDFPRAVRFCVARCCESLRAIRGSDGEMFGSEVERRLGRLESELRFLDLGEVFAQGLPTFLLGILDSCNQIGDEINEAYFFSESWHHTR